MSRWRLYFESFFRCSILSFLTILHPLGASHSQRMIIKEHKLHALCPYYAMFPPKFARENILTYTKRGDLVLDPFSGRGTTALEAILTGRQAIGLDTNPVAALISQAKIQTPTLRTILKRTAELEADYIDYKSSNKSIINQMIEALPRFFQYAYAESTLQQILFLRSNLHWKNSKTDRFIAAMILGHLHGESNQSPSYLSNQMPHTIAPKQNYAIRFWEEHNYQAPTRNAFELLRIKARFRLEDGIPRGRGHIKCADARQAYKRFRSFKGQVSALITSPPYLNVTNFEEDQWLRLWFLGSEPKPTYGHYSKDDRHINQDKYFAFLHDVWKGVKQLMKPSSILICRIGTRHISYEEMVRRLSETICDVWPRSVLIGQPAITNLKNCQTEIFQPSATGCKQEYDFVFRLRDQPHVASAVRQKKCKAQLAKVESNMISSYL